MGGLTSNSETRRRRVSSQNLEHAEQKQRAGCYTFRFTSDALQRRAVWAPAPLIWSGPPQIIMASALQYC